MTDEVLALSQGVAERVCAGLPSPKITRKDRRESIYPYYAGFSEAFVEVALDRLGVDENASVLDPWSGSGTVIFSACRRGANATGIDLNPVQTDIAAARCAHHSDVELVAELLAVQAPGAFDVLRDNWCQPYSAIHKFEKRLFECVNPVKPRHAAVALLRAVIYSSIRRCSLSSKSQNPTWFKSVSSNLIDLDLFISVFIEQCESLVGQQRKRSKELISSPSLITSDFSSWKAPIENYDAIITSPPYLTRIDYVRATYPEILYRSQFSEVDIPQLRSLMLGTPLTSGLRVVVPDMVGYEALRILKCIKNHTSKASATYYYRFYSQYFVGLSYSIAKIVASLKCGGGAAIVVQDSRYKEIHVNLARIVQEMGKNQGLLIEDISHFAQSTSINNINLRSISAKARLNPIESVIFFRKPK